MIAEWLTSLRISCPAHIRTLGYPKELVAIAYRANRQRAHWHNHLEETRNVIKKAMETNVRKGVVVILGAGILLDIPLEEICRQFRQVILADIVFLPGTRKRAARFPNCHLICCDITGTAERLAGLTGAQMADRYSAPPVPEIPAELTALEPDLTVSVNILSQLPVLPKRHLERYHSGQTGAEIDGFCRSLISHHLGWLQSLPGAACLISDTQFTYYHGRGDQTEMVEQVDPLFGVPLPDGGTKWMWEVAPPGELANGIGRRNLVRAISFANE